MPVLLIQALLVQIQILLFTLIRIWIRFLLFNLIRIRIRLFGTDPDLDPYGFKEVRYLKQYFSYIFTWFSLSVGLPVTNQKANFVKFSLPANFVVLIRVAYGSGSQNTWKWIWIRENYTDPNGSGSATLLYASFVARWLDHYTAPHLDTMTLQPAPSNANNSTQKF